jgi:hypothetical protein
MAFIHQSIALVEFTRNMLFLRMFEVISDQKIGLGSLRLFGLLFHLIGGMILTIREVFYAKDTNYTRVVF